MHTLQQAIQASATMASLAERVAATQAMLARIRPILPGTLASQVQAGPVEDGCWTLLAANPAVAGKLRQLQPALLQALQTEHWPLQALRIQVRQPG